MYAKQKNKEKIQKEIENNSSLFPFIVLYYIKTYPIDTFAIYSHIYIRYVILNSTFNGQQYMLYTYVLCMSIVLHKQ